MTDATLPRFLLLTDRSQLRLGRGLVRTVRECVDVGLSHVVVREHDLTPAARAALVRSLAGVPGLTVISSRIHDPCADGLHLPAAPADAGHPAGPTHPCNAVTTPRYMRDGQLRGRSCHTTADVRRAAREGVDYVTLGPYADTSSKPGYGPPLPREAYAGHSLPVFALGGITVANAVEARSAGAHGVAVMGAVMRAGDPSSVVARLLEAVR